jgi:hypothetical protein
MNHKNVSMKMRIRFTPKLQLQSRLKKYGMVWIVQFIINAKPLGAALTAKSREYPKEWVFFVPFVKKSMLNIGTTAVR